MSRRIAITLAIGVVGAFVFATAAFANYTVTAGHGCSVTAWTPTVTPNNGYLSFGGAASCAKSSGRVKKYVEVCEMVDFAGTWVDVRPSVCFSSTLYSNPTQIYFTATCSPGAEYASDVDGYVLTGSGWADQGYFASWQNFSVQACP